MEIERIISELLHEVVEDSFLSFVYSGCLAISSAIMVRVQTLVHLPGSSENFIELWFTLSLGISGLFVKDLLCQTYHFMNLIYATFECMFELCNVCILMSKTWTCDSVFFCQPASI